MLALSLLLGLAHAGRIVVDAAGGGDFSDIQDAVDAARPGDHIVVYPGTYSRVQLLGWAGPILAIDGPAVTEITNSGSNSGVLIGTPSPARVEGFRIEGCNAGVYIRDEGDVTLRRVWVSSGCTYGVYVTGNASLDARGLVVQNASGRSLYAYNTTGTITIDGATLVDSASHLYAYNAHVDLTNVVTWGATVVDGCGGGASVNLRYALIADVSGSPYGACVSASNIAIGVDPQFIDFTDDGVANDDLELAADSPGVDAGDPGCVEPDGSACDLGGLAGPVGDQLDDDGDGMPEAWELAWGMDPTLDDGALDDDGDGLDNLGEYLFGTDPLAADSDADGIEDLDELRRGFDPLNPDDQVPTAALSVPEVGFVGEPASLDAAGSSDPFGDPLRYSWRFTARPQGSALRDADLPQGPSGRLIPDRPGRYGVEVEVSDGTWTDTASGEVQVIESRTVRVPQDFASWAAVSGLLQDGMEVVFDEGSFEIDQSVPSGITLRGQGVDETTLVHPGGRPLLRVDDGGVLRIRDMTLSSEASYGLYPASGSWMDLQRVRVEQPNGIAAYVSAGATLTGVDLELDGAQGVYNNGGVVHIGRSTLTGVNGTALVDSYGARTRVQGALLEGSVSLTGSDDAALSFVTVHTTDSGVVATNARGARVDHVLFWQAGPSAYCNTRSALLLDHVVSAVTALQISGCDQALTWISGADAPAPDGRLSLGSQAIDAGDWRLRDADGSPADIGATGGPFGLYSEDGLRDPEEDLDGDGLSAALERLLGASDLQADSDQDGVPDQTELRAGDDPADPDDHMAQVRFPTLRTAPGVDITGVLPTVTRDPDGDSCAFSWVDGLEGPRTVRADAPGRQALPWRLVCGDGQRSGVALALVEEVIEVPGDMPLSQALSAAEDHHVLRLDAGLYVDEVDLSGRATALIGAGPETELYNFVTLDHPDAWISDLAVVDQGLRMRGGQARRIDIVNTDAWLVDVDGRNLRTRGGDLQARGAETELALSTAHGNIALDAGSVWCVAATGELRDGLSAPATTVDGASGFDLDYEFIRYDEDPEEAILDPWPRSTLWDACRQGGVDLDGSVADIGHTGGPEARQVDVDGDGMSDAWEAWRRVDDPDLDADGDGLTNLEEFLENTDPLDRDTDGDRYPDGEDARPLHPNTDGVVARIDVDRFPVAGQVVIAGGGRSEDPADTAFEYAWALETPEGSSARPTVDGDRLSFLPDVQGAYDLTLTVTTEDGEQATATERVWLGALRVVAEGESPQPVIDDANPGDRVVLREGVYRDNLHVDKDLVLTHAMGAMSGRLDAPAGAPALSISGGAVVRVEALTLEPDDNEVGVLIYEGELELRQARVVGGLISIQQLDGDVDLRASVVIGAYTMLDQTRGRAAVSNCVLGYSLGGAPFNLYSADLEVVASVLDLQSSGSWPITGSQWSARFDHVLVQGSTELLRRIEADHVRFADARFLLSPSEAGSWLNADLRLSPSSPGIDQGPPGRVDFDGSRMDIGAFGGAWGDWRGVDNDRDGFTNLDGDCDDADPEVWPDPYTGRCGDEGACGGCDGGGSSAFGLWMLAALLGLRRARAAS